MDCQGLRLGWKARSRPLACSVKLPSAVQASGVDQVILTLLLEAMESSETLRLAACGPAKLCWSQNHPRSSGNPARWTDFEGLDELRGR